MVAAVNDRLDYFGQSVRLATRLGDLARPGELLLSPMGLSLVSKLSPVRLTSLMMGGWFLATSIGNKLSGILATMWDGYENKAHFFWVNFALLMFATFIIFAMLKWLNRIMKEKGVN